MKLRGYVALGIVCLGLFFGDVVQRLVIAPWVRLRPSRRVPVLGAWQQLCAWYVLWGMSRLGGAKIPPPPVRIPAEPGQLILMNHQSLFDIPLVVRTVTGGYPRIVTRTRYSRFIPLISHMTRLYQYPTVDPTVGRSELRASMEALRKAGAESDVPIVVFPEGQRTKDGEICKIRRGALGVLLATRPWTVHVLVADGFWKAPRFDDLAREVAHIDGRFAYAGTLEWDDPTADPMPFIERVREMMVEALAGVRASSPAA